MRAQPCRAVLGAAPVSGPAAKQGGVPASAVPPAAAPRGGCFRRLRSAPAPDTRSLPAPSGPTLRARQRLARSWPRRSPAHATPSAGGRSLVFPWGCADGRHAHPRSCHSVLLLLGRPPATTAQLRPIAAPRLIPRAPLASGSVAPDAAAPRGSTPLRSGRPRAILDPVITDWSCAPRGRSLGCPRLPHGGADGSRPEKLAPRGVPGGGGVDLAGPVPDRRRFFRSDGGRFRPLRPIFGYLPKSPGKTGGITP